MAQRRRFQAILLAGAGRGARPPACESLPPGGDRGGQAIVSGPFCAHSGGMKMLLFSFCLSVALPVAGSASDTGQDVVSGGQSDASGAQMLPEATSETGPVTSSEPLSAPGVSDNTENQAASGGLPRPPARSANLPRTRWEHRPGSQIWTRAALSALKTHGAPLVRTVPRDVAQWCPAYPDASDAQRRAFWVGFMSALAKHESTYRADAVGGGGLWYGLLQILPATARGYRCYVGQGEALKNGAANLSCAVRIMAVTVPRDQVIAAKDRRWRGVAADWGPMRSASKRRDMATWLQRQSYCKPLSSVRPKTRPAGLRAAPSD